MGKIFNEIYLVEKVGMNMKRILSSSSLIFLIQVSEEKRIQDK